MLRKQDCVVCVLHKAGSCSFSQVSIVTKLQHQNVSSSIPFLEPKGSDTFTELQRHSAGAL